MRATPSSIHICHLTVLNPALHSRIFYKEALSQFQAGYQVSVIGQDASPTPYISQGVQIIPSGEFDRISWARIRTRKHILKLALAQQADVYQIHTPELLPIAKRILAVRPKARILYDMHEDYSANILHGNYYPALFKRAIARSVRRTERDFVRWGHGLIYAETCFEGLLPFPPEKTITVLNKFVGETLPPPPEPNPIPVLALTGTVAENWGLLRALDLWTNLNHISPVHLILAGKAYDPDLKDRIRQHVADHNLQLRFEWHRDGHYVPHEELIEIIRAADLGLAPYILTPHITPRIPTKFYEYMSQGTPLLFTDNPAWNQVNALTHFGYSMPWPLPEDAPTRILDILQSRPRTQVSEAHWSWQPESEKLIDWLPKVLE